MKLDSLVRASTWLALASVASARTSTLSAHDRDANPTRTTSGLAPTESTSVAGVFSSASSRTVADTRAVAATPATVAQDARPRNESPSANPDRPLAPTPATLGRASKPAAAANEDVPGAVMLAELLAVEERERLSSSAWQGRVGEHLSDAPVSRLLQDVRVRLTAYESADDQDLALGARFDFQKTLLVARDASAESLDFVAFGNLAFEQGANPDDFMSFTLRARWFGTHVLEEGRESRTERASSLTRPTPAELQKLAPEWVGDVAGRMAREHGGAAGDREDATHAPDDPQYRALARRWSESVERTLPAELAWDFDLHGGLESSQDFSSRQFVFGAAVSARPISFDPGASSSQLDVFDYPAALVRWLSGRQADFTPSGLAWPTLLVGFDVVDAGGDDLRDALTDDRSFLRARLEATWRSELFELEGEPLRLAFGWRHHQELDAPGAISRADLDSSDYLHATLELPHGLSLGYSTGRLPLDARDDTSFALGYDLRF